MALSISSEIRARQRNHAEKARAMRMWIRAIGIGALTLLAGMMVAFLAAFASGAALAQAPSPDQTNAGVVINRSTINSSATIAAANIFQQILPSILNSTTQRQALTIQNNNTTDACWVHIGTGTPETGNSMLLTAGGSYQRYWPYVPSDAFQATCANTSDTLYIDIQ